MERPIEHKDLVRFVAKSYLENVTGANALQFAALRLEWVVVGKVTG